MSHLVFVENHAQAKWIQQSMEPDLQTRLVAVTAEALQALEECGLPHEAVSAYADTCLFAAECDSIAMESMILAQEIETFIAQRYSGVDFDGVGFLSGQACYIHYFVSAVATRAFLMRETIRACSPRVVSVFGRDVDPWFVDNGCHRNPMLDLAQSLAREHGFRLEVIEPASSGSLVAEQIGVTEKTLEYLRRAHQYANGKKLGLLRRVAQARSHRHTTVKAEGLDGLRLLFVGPITHDWHLLLKHLRFVNGVECFSLPWVQASPVAGNGVWTFTYSTTMHKLWTQATYEFPEASPVSSDEEIERMSELFDEWLRQRPKAPSVSVLGCDLLPALIPNLRLVASHSPAIARHADDVAERVLRIARPHAACFLGLAWMADKRMAFHCRRQGIPVVSYQHGGSIGTHVYAPHELNDFGQSDYFLTYGEGIRTRARPVFPVRARLVPVGSTVQERVRSLPRPFLKGRRKKTVKVLWISEVSIRNTMGSTHLTEDTRRYLLQKSCLMTLSAASNLRVTYRPGPPGTNKWHQGTTQWLKSANLPSNCVALRQPLVDLIQECDIVISDRAASTVWNEAIAQQKPLILYCNPRQTRLLPHFVTDLEQACYWCKTEEMFVAAVQRLATEGADFVAELRNMDTSTYLENYVLHRNDGKCVQRIVGFINSVCRHGQPVDEWERSVNEGFQLAGKKGKVLAQ